MQANPAWVQELEIMVASKVKAEIQALSSFGFQYLSQARRAAQHACLRAAGVARSGWSTLRYTFLNYVVVVASAPLTAVNAQAAAVVACAVTFSGRSVHSQPGVRCCKVASCETPVKFWCALSCAHLMSRQACSHASYVGFNGVDHHSARRCTCH